MAIVIKFRITATKFKNDLKEQVAKDWENMGTNTELNENFIESLQRRTKYSTSINGAAGTAFNEQLLMAAQEKASRI